VTGEGPAPVMALIRRAAKDGRKTAIYDPPKRLSYGEMLARVEIISANLAQIARPGSRVAVCLPRGAEQICALLGVIDAGLVAVLLDPANPPARLEPMLEDTEPEAILVNDAPPAVSVGWRDRFVNTSLLSRGEKHLPASTRTAYVVFTSGSTGRPKGVQVGHDGLLEHTIAFSRVVGLRPDDVTVQFASPGFDVLIEEVFPTFATGGTLVIRPDNLWTPEEFADFLAEHRITNLALPSGYWAAMFWDDDLRADLKPNPELRFIIVGAEKTTREAHAKWRDSAFRDITLFNLSGPTEIVVSSNAWDVPAELPAGVGDAVPLGPPIGDRTMYIRDPGDLAGPEPEIGELLIGGTIAEGYVGRPEETARRFVHLPSGERVFRSGDRVRRIEPGCFEFLGRFDDQVQVRGIRVELGEVESAIRALPHVNGVVAAPDPERSGLVALVVLDRQGAIDELEAGVRAVLPTHMVPRLKSVERLPQLVNDKLDRKAAAAAFLQ
jgi:amino acid adenylation domain-containing protein